MHIIDSLIMKLSTSNCTIKDFYKLLDFCETKDSVIDYAVINENTFYFPEGMFVCNMAKFPLLNRDPNIHCSPVICTVSGENFVLVKTVGENFILDQFTSITAGLLGINENFENVRLLDARFRDKSSVYLIAFNGNSCN